MKILHITPHMGGGVGTVLLGWMERIVAANDHEHEFLCLDYANDKAIREVVRLGIQFDHAMEDEDENKAGLLDAITEADIVLVHYWDHPMLKELFSRPLPPCRLVFWSHKNIPYSQKEMDFPDLWVDTSPIQGHGKFIWSTGDMTRFLAIKPKAHEGFNIGYVGTVDYKKLHPDIIPMCREIKKLIPEARFTFVGENKMYEGECPPGVPWTFTGKVDDVAPYLAEMDVFGYPLRPDHYGTCEQALGEAMAAGVVTVTMDNLAERFIDEATARTKEEFIRMVEMLYQAPQAREVFAVAQRKRAKELYSIDTMISQWNDTFEELMKRSHQEKLWRGGKGMGI